MPNSVLIVILVELALILLTTTLLIQPTFLFKPEAVRRKKMATWSGLVFLCLTFCWSIVVGIILSMNGLSLSI